MTGKINTLGNGGSIGFDTGCFDDWCVFVSTPEGKRYAPADVEYFSKLRELGEKFGLQKVYDDFVVIYNRTTKNVDSGVFELIRIISSFYNEDALEIELCLNVIYAGMVSEENKANAVLKKRIKRLGIYQVLIENSDPKEAAMFSKGKKWRELDELMIKKGF